MSKEFKAWPTLGYIKDSMDSSLDGYVKLDKNLTLQIDGEEINSKSIGMPKFLTVYDKVNKQELVVGKLVKKRATFGDDTSKLQVFIALEPNVTFKYKGDKVNSSGFGLLESKDAQLGRLDNLLADGKITEEQFDESSKNISYSKAKITLPPQRD